MSAQRFRLGTFFGVGLYVHWTFGLLVLYVMYVTLAAGGSLAMVAFSVTQLLTIFVCVTLHEYGHAIAARYYGVGTHDITLLPIGGVARLKQIPRVPLQEFVIALAGPAVNVVIAACLLMLILLLGFGWFFESLALLASGAANQQQQEELAAAINQVFEQPSLFSFLLSILAINIILVLFNMIPAFPMDGGRVLRSIFAMLFRSYITATRWAQRIGLVCAMLMVYVVLAGERPQIIMLLIAAFIAFAGFAEVRQVELRDAVEGLRVGDVMTTNVPVVRADMTADELWDWWSGHGGQRAPIVGMGGVLLGQIKLRDLAQYLRRQGAGGDPAGDDFSAQGEDANWPSEKPPRLSGKTDGGNWAGTAIQLADPKAEVLDEQQSLESVLGSGRPAQQAYPVVDQEGRLVGWLEMDTALQRAAIARSLPAGGSAGRQRDGQGTIDHRV